MRRGQGTRPPWADALLAVGAVVLVAAAIAVPAALLLGGERPPTVDRAEVVAAARDVASPANGDPFAYRPSDRREFERRAAAGVAHILYARSPGGAIATAERTERFREQVERAAEGAPVSPDLLEAIVFLESAGRPQVIAGDDPEAASGLTQIVASTGLGLLGMDIDLERSRELTKQIGRAAKRGKPGKVARLIRRRARVDPRFDPDEALAASVRYLNIALARFGREDLAIASYHMGIGNLESVIHAYTGEPSGRPTAAIVAEHDLSYAQLYFDSSPARHAAAWELLAGFGDESAEYLWKVLAAGRLMQLHRDDPIELARLAELYDAKATQEEVFHPEDETEVFEDPGDIEDARADGELVALPEDRSLGFRPHRKLGELAKRNGAEPELYRALRPEALALLIYMARRVRALNGDEGTLIVTSAVRDRSYQDQLIARNPEATHEYSLHTTGWSIDVLRRYSSKRQAESFQFMLDRLQALNVIDYAVEPAAIHITVSDEARALVE